MNAAPRPAVFVDKDGTLVHDLPFNVDPRRLRFTPHAMQALQLLSAGGYALVVVSNQSGVARGYFLQAALDHLFRELAAQLGTRGIRLAGIYSCPHAPGDDGRPLCACRKPEPGMLLRAAQELGLDLQRSWMVGDILHDVEAGRRAGCRTVLMDVGNETEWDLSTPLRQPHHRVPDLLQAARRILDEDGQARLQPPASALAASP